MAFETTGIHYCGIVDPFGRNEASLLYLHKTLTEKSAFLRNIKLISRLGYADLKGDQRFTVDAYRAASIAQARAGIVDLSYPTMTSIIWATQDLERMLARGKRVLILNNPQNTDPELAGLTSLTDDLITQAEYQGRRDLRQQTLNFIESIQQDPTPVSPRRPIEDPIVYLGNLTIDFGKSRIRVSNQDATLGLEQYKLLSQLCQNQGQVVPWQTLLSEVKGEPSVTKAGKERLWSTLKGLKNNLGDTETRISKYFETDSRAGMKMRSSAFEGEEGLWLEYGDIIQILQDHNLLRADQTIPALHLQDVGGVQLDLFNRRLLADTGTTVDLGELQTRVMICGLLRPEQYTKQEVLIEVLGGSLDEDGWKLLQRTTKHLRYTLGSQIGPTIDARRSKGVAFLPSKLNLT